MNTILEQKLRGLIDEAERQGAPAMYTVLHLLYASYLQGNQNRFARHSCSFTPLELAQVSVTDEESPEEWLTELDPDGNKVWLAQLNSEGYIN
jgi:hypothetical protein